MKRIELDKNVIDEIIRLYNEEMLGSPSISKKLGINRHIVLRVLKENNVKVGVPGQKFKGGKKASEKRNYPKYRDKKLQTSKTWYQENKQHRKEYLKQYREKNIDKIRETKRNYEKYRKSTDPIYKLISNFRTAIYIVLKENKLDKYSNYFNMVGYSALDLKEHLEKRFIDGMTWENYGEWHIDHIKPISSFVFESVDDKEFKECWSLNNLQPMWGVENIKKSNKLL
jgi:hypothetical protein